MAQSDQCITQMNTCANSTKQANLQTVPFYEPTTSYQNVVSRYEALDPKNDDGCQVGLLGLVACSRQLEALKRSFYKSSGRDAFILGVGSLPQNFGVKAASTEMSLIRCSAEWIFRRYHIHFSKFSGRCCFVTAHGRAHVTC
jgi:hypothetical protein